MVVLGGQCNCRNSRSRVSRQKLASKKDERIVTTSWILSAYALKRCSWLHDALSKGRFIALAITSFEVALEEVISFFAWGERARHLVMGSGAKLCCKRRAMMGVSGRL